jgi:hypothetical protein
MNPTAIALSVPVRADTVASPKISCGDGPSRIDFILDDEESWGRVTFEKLDSLRVSRGEYSPQPHLRGVDGAWSWVSTIAESAWLAERYAYEKRHYGDAYELGGDVDEMIRDYRHFVFSFHDEFVEAIAAGIWLERSSTCMGSVDFSEGHPLSDLSESTVSTSFVAHGITCEVRQTRRSFEELWRDATLCSQKVYQFGVHLDGRACVHWRLRLRKRQNRPVAQLCGYSGNVIEEFDQVPSPEELRPRIAGWLAEVAARRASRR